jgi:NADP-dependent 3-hydroxy acid dehydrogenase YdfG
VHWNAYASGLAGDLTKAPESELRSVFDVGVHGLLAAVQSALPDLQEQKGAVLVTGGGLAFYDPQADKMGAEWGAMGLAVSKAAQHKLVGLLYQKLTKLGVYAGEVTVTALVKGTAFDGGHATLEPSTVADAFWKLYQERSTAYTVVP